QNTTMFLRQRRSLTGLMKHLFQLDSQRSQIHDSEDDDPNDLCKEVANYYKKGKGDETDTEDGPDWQFDNGKETSKDPKYVFCPAPHQKQLLHIFAKHFCQHPSFVEHDGKWDAERICQEAVYEMYMFCHFRYKVICRRVLPIYQHPKLKLKNTEDSPFTFNDFNGSITDGNDHIWSGDQDILHGGGGWHQLAGSFGVLGKRRTVALDQDLDMHAKNLVEVSQASSLKKRPHTIDLEFIDLTYSSPPPEITKETTDSPLCSSSLIQYGSGDEQELDDYIEQIQKKADAFEEAAQILHSQIQFKNQIWMKSLSDCKFGHDVMDFIDDIRVYEKT
ncbi:hypothetical protein C0995_008729, partial [Termitomyces sp. Mi166